jgi:hypothetical protein
VVEVVVMFNVLQIHGILEQWVQELPVHVVVINILNQVIIHGQVLQMLIIGVVYQIKKLLIL